MEIPIFEKYIFEDLCKELCEKYKVSDKDLYDKRGKSNARDARAELFIRLHDEFNMSYGKISALVHKSKRAVIMSVSKKRFQNKHLKHAIGS